MATPKAKGTVLVDVVKSLRKLGPAAQADVRPDLRHYLEDRIMPFQWYSERDIQDLMEVLARHLPGPREQVLHQMGEFSAMVHLKDIYSALMKDGDPVKTFRGVVKTLWSTQHDTGKLEVVDMGEDWAEASLTGYEAPAALMCRSIGGYLSGTVRLAGGRDPRTLHPECVEKNDPRCLWRLEWTD